MVQAAVISRRGEYSASDGALEGLLAGLQMLDDILAGAMDEAAAAYGPEAATDPYRGLHVGRNEIRRLLARLPCVPVLADARIDSVRLLCTAVPGIPGLAWLQSAFDLNSFELAVVLVALAPELDLRYERLYAYLQDDVTRRRPSVDLVLALLCPTPQAKMERRQAFAPDAPLIRHRLISLVPETNHVQPPLLAHSLKVDSQVVRLLLGEVAIDERLATFCRLMEPEIAMTEVLPPAISALLPMVALPVHEASEPLHLYVHGPAGVGQRQAAHAIARSAGAPLLAADLRRLAIPGADMLPVLFREAGLQGAVLWLEEIDGLLADTAAEHVLRAELALASGVIILTGQGPWTGDAIGARGVTEVVLRMPDYPELLQSWSAALRAHSVQLPEADIAALAARYRLSYDQVAAAVPLAMSCARCRNSTAGPGSGGPSCDDLFAAARSQSSHALETLTRKVMPVATWTDLVLPEDARGQLQAMCQRIVARHRVLDEWGFGPRLSGGKGVNALFAGPSGAGKTMAAEVIANDLKLDLYTVDLASVVSKYIGETEKNLDRIFGAAENANAILFFDEADALFGKRSEVRDSHDRYANIEISYILQKMEQYDGVAILATNLRGNLDDAFIRRLAFAVYFPFPDRAGRQRIWEGLWPAQTPRAADVDLPYLANTFALSGGNIKNVALAAAFVAAGDGGVVRMEHLFSGVVAEYQKMGKHVAPGDLMTAYRER